MVRACSAISLAVSHILCFTGARRLHTLCQAYNIMVVLPQLTESVELWAADGSIRSRWCSGPPGGSSYDMAGEDNESSG